MPPARARPRPARRRASRSSWCSLMSSTRPARSVNGWPWAGSTTLTPSSVVHPVERVEELGERVVGVADAGDVRRDRGQHVVAGQHDALGRVVQAQVVGGVAGRVHGDPLAPGERHHVGVVEPAGGLRAPSCRRGTPRGERPIELLSAAGAAGRPTAAGRSHGPCRGRLRGLVGGGRLGVLGVGLGGVPPHAEALVGDDVGAALLPEARRPRRSGRGASG